MVVKRFDVYLIELDPEHIRADFETGFCKNLVFFDALQAGDRKLPNFKSRRRREVKDHLVGAPAKAEHSGNNHRNLREPDDFRQFHAVLENRCESVSESLVTLPAPITTMASPSLALPIMYDSIISEFGA